jgi:biotin-(acetyl-CoA carboxylase) ligase
VRSIVPRNRIPATSCIAVGFVAASQKSAHGKNHSRIALSMTLRSRVPMTVLPDCPSTMAVAAGMFETSGAVPPFAVRAVQQTKGRGSGERAWLSPPGNLYLTLVLPSPASRVAPAAMSLFPCALGVALFDALNGVVLDAAAAAARAPAILEAIRADVARSPLVLKWPNDVLVRATGQKLCGNIIEAVYCKASKESALSLGIGVNVLAEVAVADGGRAAATLFSVARGVAVSALSAASQAVADAGANAEERPQLAVVEEALAAAVTVDLVGDAVVDAVLRTVDAWAAAPAAILTEYSRRLDMTTKVFQRIGAGSERATEPLQPVRVNEYGSLVALGADGREVVLTSDYVF